MQVNTIDIMKSSGEKVKFSLDKLRASLKSIGAHHQTINQIVDNVRDELYHGISTKEIYNSAFAILKKNKNFLASKYKLKKAIYKLGATGSPFELFIGALLKYSGYKTEIDIVLQGPCVPHEVDVMAYKNNKTSIIECK